MQLGNWKRIIAVAFILGFFYWFGESLRPLESSLQHEFDTWLSDEHEALKSAVRFAEDNAQELHGSEASSASSAATAEIPSLEAEIFQPGSDKGEVFRVVPGGDAASPQRILRLLDLMKESGVFNRQASGSVLGGSGALIRIRVKGNNRNFESALTQADAEGSVPTLLLLKLFKEYAQMGARAANPSGSAQSDWASPVTSSVTQSSAASSAE